MKVDCQHPEVYSLRVGCHLGLGVYEMNCLEVLEVGRPGLRAGAHEVGCSEVLEVDRPGLEVHAMVDLDCPELEVLEVNCPVVDLDCLEALEVGCPGLEVHRDDMDCPEALGVDCPGCHGTIRVITGDAPNTRNGRVIAGDAPNARLAGQCRSSSWVHYSSGF